MTSELDQLTDLFRKLGAPNPNAWASSQVHEGIPQLARFLFLRQAWKVIVGHDQTSWVDNSITQAEAAPDAPGSAIGPALKRLREKGASDDDLTTVVRVMQWRALAAFSYLLDDPGELEEEVKNIAWRLFQVDEEDKPVARVSGLHESVLETDPTGTEMQR